MKIGDKVFRCVRLGDHMTKLSYSRDTDAFKVESEHGTQYVPYALIGNLIDQDLRDCMRQAMDNPGDVITVPSTSKARGLRPRTAQKYFVQ
jgi:hypothetical protein